MKKWWFGNADLDTGQLPRNAASWGRAIIPQIIPLLSSQVTSPGSAQMKWRERVVWYRFAHVVLACCWVVQITFSDTRLPYLYEIMENAACHHNGLRILGFKRYGRVKYPEPGRREREKQIYILLVVMFFQAWEIYMRGRDRQKHKFFFFLATPGICFTWERQRERNRYIFFFLYNDIYACKCLNF